MLPRKDLVSLSLSLIFGDSLPFHSSPNNINMLPYYATPFQSCNLHTWLIPGSVKHRNLPSNPSLTFFPHILELFMIIQGPRESDGDAVAFVEGHPSPHVQRAALVGFIDPKKNSGLEC